MNSNQNIRVYLADDHEIVAKAIANLLVSIKGIKEVKTFSNGKELYQGCLSSSPDLIILDMEMPEWNGMATLKKLKELHAIPVIMLTMNDEKAMIEESIKEGAKGYLHKNCTQDELEKAIATVMDGNIFLSEDVKKIMVGLKQSGTAHPDLTEPLTEKELEVLRLVCEGLTSKEIGEKLFLSPRTVETRKNNLMQKFNVQTTGKLIAIAIKNKIVK
jgi:two-component system, NarL family, response regulator DegU